MSNNKEHSEQSDIPIEEQDASNGPITSTSGNRRPAYTYDSTKVTLRFIFANRDGLAVTMECTPNQTIGEVKGALLSVWPEDLPKCSGGDQLRLVCMGKGILMPDSRSLEECQVPVFKTHPTPVNVSVKPDLQTPATKSEKTRSPSSANSTVPQTTVAAGQGCCVIL